MRRTTNPRSNPRKRSGGNGNGGNGSRGNGSRRMNQAAGAIATDPRLVTDLLDEITTLKAQNRKLQDDLDDAQGTIDEAIDTVTCTDETCSAEDH